MPFVLTVLAVQGCLNTDFEEEIVSDDSSVTFTLSSGSYAPVKSSFGWGEKEIRTAQIIVTDAAGTIMDDLWTSTGGSLSFRGVKGNTYYAWAAVNLGERITVNSLSDFTSGSRTVSYGAVNSTGIPMFSDGGVEFTVGSGNSVTIDLTRMLARIDFAVNLEDIEKGCFTVNSVDLYSAVSSYTPFEESVSGDGGDGCFDSAGTYDITTLNNGGTITLYAFENMQGNLLSGNTDPWAKVPDNLGDDASKCTYLEMTASYSCQGLSVDEITYRMYLGGNATTNFDIRRNTKYEVTLYPSEDEITENEHNGSWKIEVGDWNDSRSLVFEEHTLTIFALDTDSTVGIVKSPADLEYDFSYDAADAAAAGLAVTHTGDLVSLESSVDLEEVKTLTLYIQTPDGVKHDECVVTVRPRVVLDYIEITPADAAISVGGTQEYVVRAHYSDGTEVVVTDDAVIMSSDTDIASVDGNVAEGLADGTVTITATYEGEEAEATLTVSDVITHEYELTAEADPTAVYVGETTSLTGTLTRYEVVNGVRSGESETVSGVTLTWHSDDTGVVSVNSSARAGTGVSGGTAHVWCTCTYDGEDYESNMVEITVSDVITREYEVIASADPASINIGDDTELSAVLVEYKVVNGVRSGESRTVPGVVFDWTSSDTGVLELDGDTGTGRAEGTSDVTASCSYNGLDIESDPVTVTVSNGVASSTPMWGEITFTLNAGSDAPAKGGDTGVCSVSDVMQETWTRTYFLDGTYTDGPKSSVPVMDYSVNYSTSASGSFSTICPTYTGSNLGTTVKERTKLGTIYAYIEAHGETSDTASADVYQQQNKLISHVEQSRTPNAKQYGSWTVTGYDYYTRNYYVTISANDYTSTSNAAPASGGSTTLNWSAGHEEQTVTHKSRNWTQTATVTYLDTYTSEATENTYDTVDYDSGTETKSETGSWYSESDTPSISGSATGFSRSGTNVTIASEGTTTYSSGRSVTYTARNGSANENVTIYQEPNVVVQTIDGYREFKDLTLEADPTAFDSDGGNSYLTLKARNRTISTKTVYTSGSYTGGSVSSWSNLSTLYLDDDCYSYSKLTGDGGLSFESGIMDKAVISRNTGLARSWNIQATYQDANNGTLTSNVVTITQDASAGPVITYQLVVSPYSQMINKGETATLTATLYTLANGVRNGESRDVTSSATWSIESGSDYVTKTGAGRFAWKMGKGTATVKATYDGYSATGLINTNYYYRLSIYPNKKTLYNGQVAQFQVSLAVMDNGSVYSNLGDVTSSAVWTTNTSEFVYNDGGGQFTWKKGSASDATTVTATYTGNYGSASVSGSIQTYDNTISGLTIIGTNGTFASRTSTVSIKIEVTYADGRIKTKIPGDGLGGISVSISDYHIEETTPASGYSYGFKAGNIAGSGSFTVTFTAEGGSVSVTSRSFDYLSGS